MTVSTDSSQALEEFRARPGEFAVIVTDQNMPNLTGSMLANEVARIDPDVPVILLSGFVDSVVGDVSRSSNIRKALQKPLTNAELNSAIQDLLA